MAKALVYANYRFALVGVLVLRARERSTLTYSELVSEAGLPLNMASNPQHRNLLSQWLGELMEEEHSAGLPILAALVVRSGSGRPGPGFYGAMESLGRRNPTESEQDTHSRELQAVFEFYSARPAIVECWVEPARDRDRALIESSRTPKFFMQPIRYPAPNPEFVLIHTGALTNGRAGQYVTPEWFTGTWALLPHIEAYRFLLAGDQMHWMLATWAPAEGGTRVRVELKPEDRRVVDVSKLRDMSDGSMLFQVLFSDGVRTHGRVRRQHDALNFFGPPHNRPGWPEVDVERVHQAFHDTIPE